MSPTLWRACPSWEGPSGAGMDPVGQGATPRSRHQSKQGRKEGAEQPRGGRGCGQRQLGRAALGAAALPNLGLKNKKKRKQGGRNGARRQGRSQRLPAGRDGAAAGIVGLSSGVEEASGPRASPSRSRSIPIPFLGYPTGGGALPAQHPSAPGWRERGCSFPNWFGLPRLAPLPRGAKHPRAGAAVPAGPGALPAWRGGDTGATHRRRDPEGQQGWAVTGPEGAEGAQSGAGLGLKGGWFRHLK